MTKKIAILQSNYIPWKGYFDIIAAVDEFIIYDDVQYTKNDWRNRNKIKTPSGTQWLSIPIEQKGRMTKKIKEVKPIDHLWAPKHWKTLRLNYSKSEFFKDYKDRIAELYAQCESIEFLSEINILFLKEIVSILGIKTKISDSSDFQLDGDRKERLINLCIQAGATEYLSGPAAKCYLDESDFKNAGINLTWMDYTNYPEYNQLYPPFDHAVTIFDLIFNCGRNSTKFMKSFEQEK